ncbi:MAG TPA: gliding motility protein [Verrucomicrobiae bacterium]|nr:gliding motility protein [Verrucomicrobiae bacterium]
MPPKELEQTLRSLLKQQLADTALREQLEKLAAVEISFAGFTWLFGPELYRRNRILFRPFILSRFSTYMVLPKFRSEQIHWKGDKAKILDPWLAEVDQNDDADLFRRLYEWKLEAKYNWQVRDKRSQEITRELLTRYRSADTTGKRQLVLRKFDLWFQFNEDSACALYEIDSKAAPFFILRHLPSNWYGGDKRKLWSRLVALADARKDEDFRWKLYRRQIPQPEWAKDCLELCDRIRDATELVRELEKRHPEGFALNLAESFYRIVEQRGRDVFPYIMRHLRQVWGGWFTRGSYGKMADYAREKGWWDLWAALIRVCSGQKEFNREVALLVENTSLPEEQVVERLMALAGASREWNWPGFGITTVHQLNAGLALKFHERFPELIRGPFRLHVMPNLWGENYSRLLDRFIEVGDDEMVDTMASRIITRYERWGNSPKMLDEADKLADYYLALKSNEAVFSRRAANVLSKVPAYSIYQYNPLIKQNRLARLLFERSAAVYLADPRSLADLIEGAEIHVMALAYRALGLNDPRAREQASLHLPLLMGTLLRPMQRDTRSLAFNAVANAANTIESARLILERARDALHLPDTRYPKERLLGLIAQLLHRWPELRAAKEQPVVYERKAA